MNYTYLKGVLHKAIFCFVLLSAVAVPSAQAATNSELQAQIQSLLQQISQLKELAVTQSGQSTGSCSLPFSRNLSLGSTGADVLALQKFLNRDEETKVALYSYGSPGLETNYYGVRTKDAVRKFQLKYPGTQVISNGNVDSATRIQLAALCKNINGETPTPTPNNSSSNSNDIELKVTEATNSPDDTDVDVSRNNSTTNVSVIETDIEAQNSRIILSDIYMTIDSDHSDVKEVVRSLNIRNGGTTLDTKSVAKNGNSDITVTDTNGDKQTIIEADAYYVRFTNLSDVRINEDDTETLTIRADLKEQSNSTYDNNTEVTFTLVAIEGRDEKNRRIVTSDLTIGDSSTFTLKSN